jgi:hypothetical protein
MGKIRVKDKRGYSYLRTDTGKKGRTPKAKRWYEPSVEMDWGKGMGIKERRENALEAHGGDALATARALQALANVTTDPSTKAKAGADAKHFYALHRKEE